MNKRTFLKKVGQGAALAATLPHTLLSSPPTKPQKNWVWVRPQAGLNDDGWKKKLTQIKEAGLDAILLEVYNGNQAYFPHDRISMTENLLERMIPLCKEVGLEIHAWMWTMICTNEKIRKQHPDWYAVNGKGESAVEKPAYVDYYRFMSPCHPEVQEFVQNNVRQLAQFEDLDGVHLDYVRLPDVILAEALQPKYDIVQDREYPEYDYCYSERCRQAFKEETGIDPLKDLSDPSANKAWRQFRYDRISDLVNGKLVPEARKKGKTITAAVFPNWESVRQQWRNWELDAFLPMLYHNFYNEDLKWIKKETSEGVRHTLNNQPIYSGLFVPALKAQELSLAREMALKGGASGISLFDLGSIQEEHWGALKAMLGKG